MVDDDLLSSMKPGAWLVNVARGRLVRDAPLVRALREGRIGGAILDTFAEEPLPPSSAYYALPTVIVTPHTSWSSGRVLDRSVELFCENLRRYADGRPLINVVNPAVGY
jgi:phosphoglycerate dehydrogenase-like enzyme